MLFFLDFICWQTNKIYKDIFKILNKLNYLVFKIKCEAKNFNLILFGHN